MMSVQIVEVLRRSEQGATLPFICRADNGYTYYVKGRGAGRQSLITEYICGRLARKFGLPIADFDIVEIPQKLISAALLPEIGDLGAGLAFGSKAFHHVQEIRITQLEEIPPRVAKDVLVFDWWIHNNDRTLTAKGGNPNLLWDQENSNLVVIDHNLAFDSLFDRKSFSENHVFAKFLPELHYDLVESDEYRQRLRQVFSEFKPACDAVPDEWWWVDDGVPALFNKDKAQAMLSRFDQPDFWRIAP